MSEICDICDEELTLHISGVSDIHYGIAGHYDILLCGTCHIHSLREWQNLNLASIYESISDYYAYKTVTEPSLVSNIKAIWLKKHMGISPGETAISTKVILFFLSSILRRQYWWLPRDRSHVEKFIDVGCGSGKNVALMSSLGFESWGTDISTAVGSRHSVDSSRLVIGEFAKAELPENYFDLIVSDHALEHMPNPVIVFSKLHRLLSDDGLAYISVPNTASLSAKIFGKYWYFLGAPLHLVNYSPTTIKAVAEKVGLELVSIECEGNYQELVGSLQALANRRSQKTSTQGLIWESRFLRLIGFVWGAFITLLRAGSNLKVVLRKDKKKLKSCH